MRTVDVSFHLLSRIFWERVLEASLFHLETERVGFFKAMSDLDVLRTQASYNTGSMSTSACWVLRALACYFGPRRVLEVGTFIGRSTLSLALGLDSVSIEAEIHTCDGSNAIEIPALSRTKIIQYPRTGSTDMFRKILSVSPEPFDFLHLDGRLSPEDMPLVGRLLHEKSIIALDDFEGVEKGVANLRLLHEAKFGINHLLMYPCEREFLKSYGFFDRATTAVLVPQSLVRFTAQ